MCTPVKDNMQIYTLILFSSIGYNNTPGIQAKRLDHVLTTTYNNLPHLTTFFGDSFDGFNKSGNQLGVKSLIASNKHTIIHAFHQHLSSRLISQFDYSCSLVVQSSFIEWSLKPTEKGIFIKSGDKNWRYPYASPISIALGSGISIPGSISLNFSQCDLIEYK